MAHFGKDLDDFKGHRCIHIQSAEQNENFTVYVITVTVGAYSWSVKHRYSEFHDLHEKLTANYKLDKSLLPPKKLFGNQSESFVKKRQRELEIYLQTIILFLAHRIPSSLAYFLDFDKYEIHGITQAMAEDLYNRGESLLQSREKYEVTSLQLYSLTERLKLPEPTCDSGDVKKDLGHILDFITRSKHLKVLCCTEPVCMSNIMMNKLPFDLTLFKSLQTLELRGCNFRLINGLETVKQTVYKFEVHESSSSMKEILLQDSPHWKAEDGSLLVGYWDLVVELDLSRNSFSEIHESIQLMPNVERLDLSHNVVESIQNLQWLSQLTHLDLSHNNIRHVDSLHTKMGNVKCVRMSHNQLESLHGFVKLFSLHTLDVSHNKISSIEEVRHVSQLPCVENLLLIGNAVTTSLDYRTKSLEMFGDRVQEVKLDNESPNQKELDTVAVLQALRKAKDIKIIKKPKKNVSAASLSEVYSQSPSGSDQLSDRASPISNAGSGIVSQSVPTSMPEWPQRDGCQSGRTFSAYSQESVSSHNSGQEEEIVAEPVPEAHPFDFVVPSAPSRRQSTPAQLGNLSKNNSGGHSNSSNSSRVSRGQRAPRSPLAVPATPVQRPLTPSPSPSPSPSPISSAVAAPTASSEPVRDRLSLDDSLEVEVTPQNIPERVDTKRKFPDPDVASKASAMLNELCKSSEPAPADLDDKANIDSSLDNSSSSASAFGPGDLSVSAPETAASEVGNPDAAVVTTAALASEVGDKVIELHPEESPSLTPTADQPSSTSYSSSLTTAGSENITSDAETSKQTATDAASFEETAPNLPASPSSSSSATVEDVGISPSEAAAERSTQKRSLTSVYNAADLPSVSDRGFALWLEEQLLTPATSPSSTYATGADTADRQGLPRASVLDVLWCYAEQLSQPNVLFPCCAILSSNTVFIEKLVPLESSFPEIPLLEPCSILPVGNIQQIVIGPCHSYVRIEEAFVGKSGMYVLYAVEPHSVRKFLQNLFKVSSGMDVHSCPDCVDLSVQSDLLKAIAAREEKDCGMASDRLAVSILVKPKSQDTLTFLVLSENRVYCLRPELATWPPATFETNPQDSIPFKIIHEFSIMDMISDIKLRPPALQTESREDGETSQYGAIDPRGVSFMHYQLDLEVYLARGRADHNSDILSPETQSKRHGEKICYHFYSAAARDLFLDRLTNLRVEQSHRMSPNIREEPEGGNEQLPLSDHTSSFSHKRLADKSSTHLPSTVLSGHQNSSCQTSKQPSSTPKTLSSNTNSKLKSGVSPGSDVKSSVVGRDQSDAIPFDTSREGGRSGAKAAQIPGVSDSVLSGQSPGALSVPESDFCIDPVLPDPTPASSAAYFSSSLKDDLSVSPMSNFSRASISPPIQQERSRPARGQPVTLTKADSLPSSYEWRKYYFKSPLVCAPATAGCVTVTSGMPGLSEPLTSTVARSSGSALASDGRAILEDIESSSELDSSQRYDAIISSEETSVVETELEAYLKQCVKSYDLIQPLPAKMKPLGLMSGRELRKFFHTVVSREHARDAYDAGLAEDLHHVLWSIVIPYTNPKQEITTLVMLSTRGVYLVSDTGVQALGNSRPSWMTHSRNQSDSAFAWKTEALDGAASNSSRMNVKPYFFFRFEELHHINVGLFDQCVRLTGSNENSVFTVATRDRVGTEVFIQKLKQVLSLSLSSPMVERSRMELEQDFYRDSTQRTMSTIDGHVYTHPSQVEFVYPGEESVQDMLYLVSERVGRAGAGKSTSSINDPSSLWFYLLGYLLPSDDATPSSERTQPRSVIVTPTHFCLAEEDIVTYPLPDFVRGLPENPCHEIVECRRIDSLKRVQMYHSNPHWVTLVFMDEAEGIVVDVSMEHFAQSRESKGRHKPSPEITFRLFIQSAREKDKMVAVLERLWKQQVSQVGRILDVTKV